MYRNITITACDRLMQPWPAATDSVPWECYAALPLHVLLHVNAVFLDGFGLVFI